MSVAGSSPVAYRRFSGYADPRYPEGQWVGSVTRGGDATGGTLTASLTFAEATDIAINSRVFSLEELGVSVDGVASISSRISTDNLGSGGPAAFQHRIDLNMPVITTVTTLQPRGEMWSFLPLFLGSMRVLGVTTRILVQMINPGAGDDARLECAGYWWGPRSVLADGGPQRPPTGLYRA